MSDYPHTTPQWLADAYKAVEYTHQIVDEAADACADDRSPANVAAYFAAIEAFNQAQEWLNDCGKYWRRGETPPSILAAQQPTPVNIPVSVYEF